MKIELAKGVRDFAPEEKILRNQIIQKIRTIFEIYGYNPLETPSIERMQTLTAKFAAGEESDATNEIFKLSDQGNRDLGLRFDLTVPLARYVGVNPHVKLPFKRYEIGRVFRDGPIKLGRYREFWQCDVDIVGCSKMSAEAELMNLAIDVFDSLEIDAYVEFNNRKLLQAILTKLEVTEDKFENVIITIDKWKKLSKENLNQELTERGLNPDQINKLFELMQTKGSNEDTLANIEGFVQGTDFGDQAITELKSLFSKINNPKLVFTPTLARGLAYYTGTVFEAFSKDSKVTSSISGGGRYDNMVGMFAGKDQFPAVGISFGLEPITEIFREKQQFNKKSVAKVFIVPIKTKCDNLAKQLRDANINVDIDLMGRDISKNLKYANNLKIPFVLFAGENEIKANKYKLKNMQSGEEKELNIEEVINELK